jgi:hypothetical protein
VVDDNALRSGVMNGCLAVGWRNQLDGIWAGRLKSRPKLSDCGWGYAPYSEVIPVGLGLRIERFKTSVAWSWGW